MKTKHKIYLIEDDEVLGKVLKEELSEAGFTVEWFKDGQAGLSHVGKGQPDLVLLDVLMPKKNGFEVLEAIKDSSVSKGIPVVMLTMLGSDDDLKKGLTLGANDYIVKSQHAVGEIVDKVKEFFKSEQHPEARQKDPQAKAPTKADMEKRAQKIKKDE